MRNSIWYIKRVKVKYRKAIKPILDFCLTLPVKPNIFTVRYSSFAELLQFKDTGTVKQMQKNYGLRLASGSQ